MRLNPRVTAIRSIPNHQFTSLGARYAPAMTTWIMWRISRTTIAWEPKWWMPRRNQPNVITWLM